MTQGTLFDLPEDPSPRLRWMARHGITVSPIMMDGRCVYLARHAAGGRRRGNTEDEALIALASHLHLPGWLEEQYLAGAK